MMLAEKIILDFLKDELHTAQIPVYMERPANCPDEFVLIEKTGGGATDHIERGTFAIQSISTSLYKSACLNDTVKNKMLHLTEKTPIMRCHLNSDYNFTNTNTKEYRYQAVYEINY